jgi:sugar O-acyltransferase (sialic acid O-acetyltransferase NeuD family)
MLNPVILFGAGSTAKLALDVFQSNNLIVYGFLDDDAGHHGKEIGEIPVLGSTEDDGFLKLIGKKCDAFIAVENKKERKYLLEMLKERRHVAPVNAIHRDASLSAYAEMGHGNLLSAGCRVAAFSKIGSGCRLFPNAVVETGAQVGDEVSIGAGACIGAGVEIGDGAFIGAGATIPEGIKIGKNASVGAGSVVISDVPTGGRVFGNPAQAVK